MQSSSALLQNAGSSNRTNWQWQDLWDKLWLLLAHDKNSYDSAGVISFQRGCSRQKWETKHSRAELE